MARKAGRNSFAGLVELNHCLWRGSFGQADRQWFNKRCQAQSDSRPASRAIQARLAKGRRMLGWCDWERSLQWLEQRCQAQSDSRSASRAVQARLAKVRGVIGRRDSVGWSSSVAQSNGRCVMQRKIRFPGPGQECLGGLEGDSSFWASASPMEEKLVMRTSPSGNLARISSSPPIASM